VENQAFRMRGPSIELIDRLLPRWRRGAAAVAGLGTTIRGRILVAFLVMSMITAALGYSSPHSGSRRFTEGVG